MLRYDVERARQAVQYLVDDPYFKHHVKRLLNTVIRPRAMPFKDEAETLNELLVVGRQNREAMDNLIAMAQFKRDAKGSYMSSFMRAKRERDRKLIQIEELSAGHKLPLDERVHLLRKAHDKWGQEREQHKLYCAQKYREQFGKEPEWAHKNAFVKDFWANKDMELDVLLHKAREYISHRQHPPKREVVVHRVVHTPRNPVMADKLRLAISGGAKSN